MTEPLRPALVDIAGALGLTLEDSQVDTLLAYLALLEKWNAVYNLTSVREPQAMLTHHLADCLAVVPPLQRETGGRPGSLLDVGSGGGLPAVVIAVALPQLEVTSVDAVGKKAAFVRQVAGELKLRNLEAVHGRVEALKPRGVHIVSARAFASLADLVRLSEKHLLPDGRWLAMKGQRPTAEIDELPGTAEVFHVEQLAVPNLAGERCIVWMRRPPDAEGASL